MQKVFLSFTQIKFDLLAGSLTYKDLQQGLFHLGCARENILDERNNPAGQMLEDIERTEGKVVKGRVITYSEVFEIIRDALLKAEEEGRIQWRTLADGNSSWGMLNGLLERNGYRRLLVGDIPNRTFTLLQHQSPDEEPRLGWCYPLAKEAIDGSNQGLHCVWE